MSDQVLETNGVKVTLNQTPTEEIIKTAQSQIDVKDENGRVITLRKPGVLAQYRLIEALADTAKNEVYMSMVLPLIYVSAIDGERVNTPNTKIQVEALIQRLDEDGISAVMTGVQENFGKQDPDQDKENLKK